MLKIVLFIFLIPAIATTQNSIYKIAKDSDAIALNYTKIAEFKVTNISYTEILDSTKFIGYPINNVKYIINNCEFNKIGLATHYDWSFSDFQFPKIIDNNLQQDAFYISNDYNFEYENEQLKQINISDASQVYKIVYNYNNDSIFQEINIITKNSKNNIVKNAFNLNFQNIKYSNSGIKQYYFPYIQLINLHNINSNSILINNIPFSSFFDGKFDNKRFLIEICPYKWLFFEIKE